MIDESEYLFLRGRVAEHAIIRALGIGQGDEVVIQAFTCVAVPAPILMAGARPVYMDIEPGTYNLDPEQLDAAITRNTKAVIVQHTFGIPADMDRVLEVARRHGLAVVEDCCHTLASRFNGVTVGNFAEGAFFSHRWGKPIVLGAGGRAIVRGEQACARFRKICEASLPPTTGSKLRGLVEYLAHESLLRPSLFWLVRDIFRLLSRNGLVMPTFDEKELHGLMSDVDFRAPRWHQRLIASRLANINEDSGFRRTVARQYSDVLTAFRSHTFDLDERYDPVLLRYPLLVVDKTAVLRKARASRIELGDWYVSAVHPLCVPDDLERIGYRVGSCPVAEAVSRMIVTLPIHRRITPCYVEKTIDFLRELDKEGLLAAQGSFDAHRNYPTLGMERGKR